MDCLNELKNAQDKYNGRLDKFEDRLTTIEKESKESNNNNSISAQQQTKESSANRAENGNQGISETDKDSLLKKIKQLEGRTENNEKNIVDNIKDLNLLNKDVIGIKEELEKLKNLGANNGSDANSKGGLDLGAESINNINKQILRNREQTDKLRDQIEKLNKQMGSLKEKLDQLIKDSMFSEKEGDKEQSSNNNTSGGQGGDISRAEFNELK